MRNKKLMVTVFAIFSFILVLGCVSPPLEEEKLTKETASTPMLTPTPESPPTSTETEMLLSEGFESGIQSWSLEAGWHVEGISNNTVLKGGGHKWARLENGDWDDYVFKAKFRPIQGTIHFNYRVSELNGLQRYFIGVSSDSLYLKKQVGDEFFDLSVASLKLDNRWHEIEIRGYGNTLNIYIDDALVIVYKDDNPILSGSIAFETLEGSEFLIDDVKVRETLFSDIVDEFTSRGGTLTRDEVWSGEVHVTDFVFVPKGITLTIEPGTVVKFRHSRDYKNSGRGALIVNGGVLRAIGTPEEPIWFTSDAEEPINGDWEGIAIEDSKGDNVIKYSIIEYSFIMGGDRGKSAENLISEFVTALEEENGQ